MIITDPTINDGEHLNMLVSTSKVLGLFLLLRSSKLIITINSTKNTKTIVIRSINGKSGNAPLLHAGKNFNKVESGIVSIAAASAAAEVVRFQKKPKRKIDNTPGEIKPTYSWINW